MDLIELVEHPELGFESFPNNRGLSTFDPSDRKFVAVANAHPNKPPILQAADSKWLDWEAPLAAHGLRVDFLCPDDIKRIHAKKFGR